MKKYLIPIIILVLAAIIGSVIYFSSDKPVGPAALPFVKINDVIYIIDPAGGETDELPDTYELIGEVVGEAPGSVPRASTPNGYAAGVKIGEKIYQNPESPNEIFAYTALFSGSKTFRYVRFIYD